MTKDCSRFFSNARCEYFPCHPAAGSTDFNCLFCYCPLYNMGDRCGGVFAINAKGVKDCAPCHLPHLPEYYDVIIAKLEE